MPLIIPFVGGILLWTLASGAWATVGIVLTLLSGGLFLLFALIALAGIYAVSNF